MRALNRVFFIAASASIALAGCTSMQPRSASTDQTALLRLQDEWASARVRRDVAFLEHFYASEFRVTSLSGTVVERAADIANFASGDLQPEQVNDDDLRASLYGDVGLVTGREFLKGRYKGHTGEFWIRFTNVYVRREGRWQLLSHQATPIARK